MDSRSTRTFAQYGDQTEPEHARTLGEQHNGDVPDVSRMRAKRAKVRFGIFMGNRQLNYLSESRTEIYYSVNAAKNAWMTLDYQHIANPAYNADRGPVNVGSLRLHAQY